MSEHKPKGEAGIVAESQRDLENLKEEYEGETDELYEVELSGQEMAVLFEAMANRLDNCLSDYKRCIAADNELVADQIMGNTRLLVRHYGEISRRLDVDGRAEEDEK